METIRRDVVFKRAKLRAMHLLEDMDRTEAGLREKLRQGLYPEDAAEEAVRYVKSFGYLDDTRYAENFVRSRKGSKSRREIQGSSAQKRDFLRIRSRPLLRRVTVKTKAEKRRRSGRS